MDEIWRNTEFILFEDKSGEKIPLRGVSIERIIWEWPGKAKLTLRGSLPQAGHLFSWSNGVCLELLRSYCSDLMHYDSHELVFRFYDGKVRRKWTPHFTVRKSEHQGTVDIYVSLECSYQKFFETEG